MIEILIERDPDSLTDVTLFIDGEEVPAREIDYRHIDPGVGYLLSEWREDRADIKAAGHSRAFTAAALAAHDAAERSPYIEDDLAEPLYEKCAECHLFVEPNSSHDSADPEYAATLAEYVHLHRGDKADDELDASHEARPSGEIANLTQWRMYGPEAMRARFNPREE